MRNPLIDLIARLKTISTEIGARGGSHATDKRQEDLLLKAQDHIEDAIDCLKEIKSPLYVQK